MITLKDYLGTIISEINEARGQADVASAELARQYAKDNVLQYYTIPRMRMQDIELSIPIGIDRVTKKEETVYQPIDNRKFYSKTYQSILEVFELESLPRVHSQKLSSEIKADVIKLESTLRNSNTMDAPLRVFAKEMAIKSSKAISHTKLKRKNLTSFPSLETVQKKLEDRLKDEIQPRQQTSSIDKTEIIAESQKLKELTPDKLIHIKMKIIENGMEWHTMESEGNEVVRKLVSE